MILVGTGGQASLGQHTGKSKCRQTVKKNQQTKGTRTLFDVGLTRRVAGPVPLPPPTHISPLVQADLILEEVELDLSVEDMSTTDSGEPGDTHTSTLPNADPTAVRETLPANMIIDVDAAAADATAALPADLIIDINAADDAAAAGVTGPADMESSIIDVDAIGDIPAKPSQSIISMSSTNLKRVCCGLYIPVPSHKSPYTAYPFGLHACTGLPWDIHINSQGLHLQSTMCRGSTSSDRTCCVVCQELPSNRILEGILDRMENGVHDNTPYAF